MYKLSFRELECNQYFVVSLMYSSLYFINILFDMVLPNPIKKEMNVEFKHTG